MIRHITIIQVWILFGVVYAAIHGFRANAQVEPILPLSIKNTRIDFIQKVFLDPQLANNVPTSDDEASEIESEFADLNTQYRQETGRTQAIVAEQIFRRWLRLYWYYQESGNSSKLARSAEYLDQAGRLAKSKSVNSERLLNVRWNHAMILWTSGTDRTLAIKELKTIYARLSVDYQNRAQVLLALAQRNPAELMKMAESFTGRAKIGVILSAAELSPVGSNLRRQRLFTVSTLAESIGRRDGLAVFHKILHLWQRGQKNPWQRLPFRPEVWSWTKEFAAISERMAIHSWTKNQRKRATGIYRKLVLSARDPYIAPLTKRLIELERFNYTKTGNVKSYQATLFRAAKATPTPAIKDLAVQEYFQLLQIEFKKARSAKSSASKYFIGLAATWLNLGVPAQQREHVLDLMAQHWSRLGQHAKAVNTWIKLASQHSGQKALRLVVKAIASQNTLAKWPKTPPWRRTPANNVHLNTLRKLYAKARSLQPNNETFAAHLGLILIQQNQKRAAYRIWNQTIDRLHKARNPAKFSALALGYMLVDHERRQEWIPVVEVAEKAELYRIQPIHGRKKLITGVFLKTALLEGGKKSYIDKNYQLAIRLLNKFVKRFDGPKQPEGMFYLAKSLFGGKNHVEAVATLMEIGNKYPRYRNYKQAMSLGSDWSIQMAFEENAIFFLKKYVDLKPETASSVAHRERLIRLYKGRELYAAAAFEMERQIQSSLASNEIKEDNRLQLLRQEERFGSLATARVRANRILQRNSGSASKIQALAIKARYALENSNFTEVRRLTSRIIGFSGDTTAREIKGDILMTLARARHDSLTESLGPLSLRDPTKAASARFAEFEKTQSLYAKVCDEGGSQQCAPAMFHLSQLADKMMPVFEELDIPESLSKQKVEAFQAARERYMERLLAVSVDANAKSKQMVVSGRSDPTWTQLILWENENDWSGNSLAGEAGIGFIQVDTIGGQPK